MAEPSRRFPPPWRVDKIPGGYIVRDANGQALACVYSRENECRRPRPRGSGGAAINTKAGNRQEDRPGPCKARRVPSARKATQEQGCE